MDNVKYINHNNEIYDLEDYSVADAMRLLGIDENSVNLEVEGDTLYVLAKTGNKGWA